MSRKIMNVLAVLGIMIMALSILGCQGYEPPKYKSPAGEGDEDVEEVEIDVTDVEDDEEDFWDEEDEEVVVVEDDEEDFWDEEEDLDEEEDVVVVEDDEEDVEETTSTSPTGYVAATESDDDEEADSKKAPYRSVVEEDLPTLTVTEGELVKLTVKATDADGDSLTYDFGTPLNSEGRWNTRNGDAGVYYPEIKVSDGKETVIKTIKIVVEPKNNKPVLQFIPNVEVNEGDTVRLTAKATDADGDKLTYSFSGWMTSDTKVAGYADAGVHKVTVSVTDGISTISQDVTVTVKDVNRAPDVEIEF
ncbi:hypothetical protein ACFL3V_00025 [Nanoarchaeota archaeon]